MARNKSRARIMHELRIENDRLRRKLVEERLFNRRPRHHFEEDCEIVPLTVEHALPFGLSFGMYRDKSEGEVIAEMRKRISAEMIRHIAGELDRYAQFYTGNRSFGDVAGMKVYMVRKKEGTWSDLRVRGI